MLGLPSRNTTLYLTYRTDWRGLSVHLPIPKQTGGNSCQGVRGDVPPEILAFNEEEGGGQGRPLFRQEQDKAFTCQTVKKALCIPNRGMNSLSSVRSPRIGEPSLLLCLFSLETTQFLGTGMEPRFRMPKQPITVSAYGFDRRPEQSRASYLLPSITAFLYFQSYHRTMSSLGCLGPTKNPHLRDTCQRSSQEWFRECYLKVLFRRPTVQGQGWLDLHNIGELEVVCNREMNIGRTGSIP